MKGLTLLLLVPAALVAGQTRYARLGEFQGLVEVQLTAADAWAPAERNLPLAESTWVRTGAGGRVEIELDDGSAWRLGPDSLGEISDYTRLSTGQRITLLSLDHGTAYFSGEPRGNDVLMLVAPGAQATLGQGARVRVTAAPEWSQFSVLEGMVRFSSPSAEMGLREGQSARVEPANVQHFYLYPQVAALPLDKWSEDRDRVETAPISAAHVTWHYGLTDLDESGEWIQNEDLGMVWKPKTAEGWAPYQKGRWRYLEASGYTWVSDDSWGWMPYHNGRWANLKDLGWVWQPALSVVFKPGEVYWLHGANWAGWGPLAPGEPWTSATPGIPTPRYFIAGITSFAGLQLDALLLDPARFAAPTAEQLKAAVYARALPSPGFNSARLDATRPTLKVGRTHVDPVVPGITLSDAPPDVDMLTAPPDSQPPAGSADAAGYLPDGSYAVPVVALPVIELPVVLGGPDRSSHLGAAPAAQNKMQPTTPGTTTVVAGATGRESGGHTPMMPPASTPHEPPRVQLPKPDPPRNDGPRNGDKKSSAISPAERGIEQLVKADFSAPAPDLNRSLRDLDEWGREYPNSGLSNEREYYYVEAYNGLGRPDRVLEVAAHVVGGGARAAYQNPEQILQVLLMSTSSLQKLGKPTAQQLETGQSAARQLLEYLPEYFAPQHRPQSVNDASWSLARTQLESLGKAALGRSGGAERSGR